MLCVLAVLCASVDKCTCYVKDGALEIKEGVIDEANGYAWAYWENGMEGSDANGWYQLHVEGTSNKQISETDMMRCAGAVEGYISQKSIWNHFMLIMDMEGWSSEAPH